MEGHADYAFESFVNSERCKTQYEYDSDSVMFESFVNSERCKTYAATVTLSGVFESFVNLENMPI